MKIFKKILKWFLILLAVLVVAVFFITSFLINRYKTDIEKAISNQTGIEAKIAGNIQLKILPGFSIVVNKLNLISNETYFLRTETAEFALDFQSYFLDQNIIIKAIRLNKPQVFVFRDSKGNFNFEENSDTKKTSSSPINFNLVDLNISEGKLLYFNLGQSDTLVFSGIELSTELIKAQGNFQKLIYKDYLFQGKLKISRLKLNAMGVRNIQLKLLLQGEKISFSPDIQKFYGGTLSGKTLIDFSVNPIKTSINYEANNVKIDSLLMDFETALYLKGNMNLGVDLQFNTLDLEKAKENMLGNIELSGENVVVYGFNTEISLENYIQTKKFSAFNAGAALMAGPVGAVFTNDNSLSQLLTNDSGDSLSANNFISKWNFSKGNAVVEDVAFSDEKYRIALSGSIDFQENSYNNLTISVLYASGCPALSHQMNGTFQQPVSETISNIEAKNSSKTNFQNELSLRKSCNSPYRGSISQP